MAHKKKTESGKQSVSYKIDDVMKITEDIFNLSKEKNYNPGAFIHGLVFALEYVQLHYELPPQQIANVKRGCRKYLNELSVKINKEK